MDSLLFALLYTRTTILLPYKILKKDIAEYFIC